MKIIYLDNCIIVKSQMSTNRKNMHINYNFMIFPDFSYFLGKKWPKIDVPWKKSDFNRIFFPMILDLHFLLHICYIQIILLHNTIYFNIQNFYFLNICLNYKNSNYSHNLIYIFKHLNFLEKYYIRWMFSAIRHIPGTYTLRQSDKN